MAAAAVMPSVSIAWLHHAPTSKDLEISRSIYNTLPHPEEQPQNHIQKELQVGPQATVLFHEKDVIGLSTLTITTGWSFKVGDDGIISGKDGTVYSPKKHTHGVFVDSKPFTVELLKKNLRGEGIIA